MGLDNELAALRVILSRYHDLMNRDAKVDGSEELSALLAELAATGLFGGRDEALDWYAGEVKRERERIAEMVAGSIPEGPLDRGPSRPVG